MASAKRALSRIDEPQLKKARVSGHKSSRSLSHKNVGAILNPNDCDIVSPPPHQFSSPIPLPPVSSPPQSNVPVPTPSATPCQSPPPPWTSAPAPSTHPQMNVSDSAVRMIAGKIDELHAYLEEKFTRLEARMDVAFANISRRISQFEDIVQANVAQISRMVAADGDDGVSDPSMGLLTDASEQLGEASDMGEDVGDNTQLQPLHHETGGPVISESSVQLVHVTKPKARCSTRTSTSIRS